MGITGRSTGYEDIENKKQLTPDLKRLIEIIREAGSEESDPQSRGSWRS